MMDDDGPIHEALQSTLPEDHLLVKWALVAEIVNDEARYLVHRSAGPDGEAILVWEALGLLSAGVALATDEITSHGMGGVEVEDEEEDDGET